MRDALEVSSEMAYDLVQDHLDTLLALLDGPLPRAEVVSQLGTSVALDRLLAHGLIAAEGEQLRAVASVYHQLRQEGMMSFLSRYVLPGLRATLDPGERRSSTLAVRPLELAREEMVALRQGPVQQLFEELTAISEQAVQGSVARLSVLVVGTSHVAPEVMPAPESALTHLRQASIQRATPAERECALLSQVDFLADKRREAAARAALERFVASFAGRDASPASASYHLTVASHWHGKPTSAASHGVQIAVQPC
jgi:hypothetical protein